MGKTNQLKKLTFVRDLKVDELINLISFIYSNNSYKTRDHLIDILIKKRRVIFPLRRSISYKSAGNSLITLSNLGLIDINGKLNYKGKYLAEVLKSDRGAFFGYLSYILLFEGNWIAIIKAMSQIEKQDKNSLKFMEEVVKALIRDSNLTPGINVRDMAARIKGNHIKWLKFLSIIDIKEDSVNINKSLIKKIKKRFKIPTQG